MISCSKVRVGRCKKGVGNVVQLYIKEEEWRTDEYNTRYFFKYWEFKTMNKKQGLMSYTSGGQTRINRNLNIILY